MSILRLGLIALALSVVGLAAESVATQLAAARQLVSERKLDEAQSALNGVLETALLQGADSTVLAAVWNELGVLHRERGDLLEANRCFRQSVVLLEEAGCAKCVELAAPLANLGSVQRVLGRFRKAEQHYRRGLAIRLEELGPDHPDTANLYNNLGLLYRSQERYEEAEELLRKTVAIWSRSTSRGTLRLAAALNNLGLVHCEKQRWELAIELFSCAMTVWQRELDPGHPSYWKTLGNLAFAYAKKGRLQLADDTYQRALEAGERTASSHKREYGMLLMDYGDFLHRNERNREAKLFGRRGAVILAEYRQANLLHYTVAASSSKPVR